MTQDRPFGPCPDPRRVNDLSYDPRDPYFAVPGDGAVQWAVQVFTTENVYGLPADGVTVTGRGTEIVVDCDLLAWGGQQQRTAGTVRAMARHRASATEWRIDVRHHEPVKAVKLLLAGLPDDLLAHGWWSPASDRGQAEHPGAGQPLHWAYPGRGWVTPWAAAGSPHRAVCLSIRDDHVRPKRLYVHHPPYADGPLVELIHEEDAARWRPTLSTPSIRLARCSGATAIEEEFAGHLHDLERSFGLIPWDQRADVPAWARDVALVVTLHGQHWTGYVFNTFADMGNALRFVCEHIDGHRVLAYLPGWEGRYYHDYPHYRPGEALGGDSAFRELCTTAGMLGVRLMPMFGANGVNVARYPGWRQAVFLNRTARYPVLINRPDWDGDRSGEDEQVFCNLGEPVFRDHLRNQIGTSVRTYGLEAVFLDTSAFWFNDPRYNIYDGYRELLASLRAEFPRLLVVGEGWWDALLALFPVNQSWFGHTHSMRFPQMLARYGRTVGHLADGTPGSGSTGVHEGGFRPGVPMPGDGHLPSIGIVDDTLEQHARALAEMCRRAARETR